MCVNNIKATFSAYTFRVPDPQELEMRPNLSNIAVICTFLRWEPTSWSRIKVSFAISAIYCPVELKSCDRVRISDLTLLRFWSDVHALFDCQRPNPNRVDSTIYQGCRPFAYLKRMNLWFTNPAGQDKCVLPHLFFQHVQSPNYGNSALRTRMRIAMSPYHR